MRQAATSETSQTMCYRSQSLSWNMTDDPAFNRSECAGDAAVGGQTPLQQQVHYMLFTALLTSLAVVGIIGNVPVMIIYFQKKDKKASNTFIKVLAFLDLIVCTVGIPYTIVYEYHLVTSDVACRFFEVVRHFAVMASNITLIAVATERYIAVCRLGTHIDIAKINKGVCIIMAISFVYACPTVGIFAVVPESAVANIACMFPHEQTSGHFCHFTYSIMGESLVKAYQLAQLTFFFVELILIIVLYTAVYVVLWRRTAIKAMLTKRSQLAVRQGAVRRDARVFAEPSSCTPRNSQCMGSGVPVTHRPHDGFKYVYNEQTFCDCSTQTQIIGRVGNQNTDTSSTIENYSYCNSDILSVPQHQSIEPLDDVGSPLVEVSLLPTPVARASTDLETDPTPAGSRNPSRKRRPDYHRKTAKMLFMCTVIYFVTWVPFWVDIFGLTHSLLLRHLYLIGNATNPIVYGVMNRQVRLSLKKLFSNGFRKFSTRFNDPLNDHTMTVPN